MCQKKSQMAGDFYSQVQQGMITLEISEHNIAACSKNTLKDIVQHKMQQSAFLYLHQKAKLHSKVKHEMYTDLKGSNYFFDPRIRSDEAKMIFTVSNTYIW